MMSALVTTGPRCAVASRSGVSRSASVPLRTSTFSDHCRRRDNPINAITMEGVMVVMGHFIARIGPSENTFTLSSRRRFLAHLRARDADAAATGMAQFLERMQQGCLALWQARGAR